MLASVGLPLVGGWVPTTKSITEPSRGSSVDIREEIEMPKKNKGGKSPRRPMDTTVFSRTWISYYQDNRDDLSGYLLSGFMERLAKGLDCPVEELKEDSVRSKCYGLNKKAKLKGRQPLPVPGSGKAPGSGLPEVDWDDVFDGWAMASPADTARWQQEAAERKAAGKR